MIWREFGENQSNILYSKALLILWLYLNKFIKENTMITKEQCDEILTNYPEYISKEQMRILCHISKKTCLFLLESGTVPSIDTGQKTHRFLVKTVDVITYLKHRDRNPKKYKPHKNYYVKTNTSCNEFSIKNECVSREELMIVTRRFYKALLDSEQDVLTTDDVSRITGYATASVVKWCQKGKLRSFNFKRSFRIPKPWMLKFLCSEAFRDIKIKSELHIEFNNEIHNLIIGSQLPNQSTYIESLSFGDNEI